MRDRSMKNQCQSRPTASLKYLLTKKITSKNNTMKYLYGFVLIAVLASGVSAKSALEDLDAGFWGHVDKACQALSHDLTPGEQKDFFFRINEYTTIGYREHSVFPSAAASLMKSKHFDPKRPTVIFAHGFTDSPLLITGQTFALAYKIHGDYNILGIDSSKLINMLYYRSRFLVKFIGEYLGLFLHDLKMRGVDMSKVHLVGHSLGGHIVGFAGKTYSMLNRGEKLPRITGMDPAGPCFTNTTDGNRINATDAKFVDIIHTNIGVYGIDKDVGKVDFYPNGGHRQPGCVDSICSHTKVWQYYEESVNLPNAFLSVQCDSEESFHNKRCVHNSKAVMGFAAPKGITGRYYLKTRGFPLFGMGHLGVL